MYVYYIKEGLGGRRMSKLKRFWIRNKLKIKKGSGALSCMIGFGLVIFNLPGWMLKILFGCGIIFFGVKTLHVK